MNRRLSLSGRATAAALVWLLAGASGALAQSVSEARVAELLAAARSEAQAPSQTATRPVVDLRIDEAIKHALENNLDLKVERLNPQAYDIQLSQLRASYAPTVTSRSC